MAFNFSWIDGRRVAGMARPHAEDAPWLRAQGVTHVVSLTETPPAPLEGLQVRHEPVPDMTSPPLDQLSAVVEHIRAIVDEGGVVAVHCAAGMGRTGTFLAGYLVRAGLSAEEAIARVRAARPGSIETPDQEDVLFAYADAVREASR